MTRRAFVTGGSGFLGSAVVRALLDEGTEVRALVRPSSPRTNLEGLEHRGCELVEGDLESPDSLSRAVEGCDEAYHCAALYTFSTREPALFDRANVAGSENVVRAASAAGVARIVHTSSVAAVEPLAGGLADERREVDPQRTPGPYKRSKVLAERAVLRLAREEGCPVVVVNPSAPVGPRDVKPTPTGRLLLDFLDGRMPATVDTGLNLVCVDACARGHLLAARRGRTGERYILGGENLTLLEILERLGAIAGLRAPRLRIPHAAAIAAAHASELLARLTGRPAGIPLEGARSARHRMWFDSGKARRELGFEAPPTDEALERAVRWFVDHGRVRRPLRLPAPR